jgi:hypothetical protein
MWELNRHKWHDLQAMVNAAVVPQAIEMLLNSTTEEDAWTAAELIENNVVVQGTLFEAAPPTAACLVIALPFCASGVRLPILELLNHLCGANVSPDDKAAYLLQSRCIQEVRKGVAVYLSLLESGSLEECSHCVDLLCMCAMLDPSLVGQVVYYLAQAKVRYLDADLRNLIDNTANVLIARKAIPVKPSGSGTRE